MSESPPRKRFQIHLSTAIVMMFVAGGLIWANVSAGCKSMGMRLRIPGPSEFYLGKIYGWPFEFKTGEGLWTPMKPPYPKLDIVDVDVVNYGMAGIDAVVAILILSVIWYLCEWQIRRRLAQKHV
ncbi:MAG: hypothetical protein WCT04_16020 [Planctomycetota bacterium]